MYGGATLDGSPDEYMEYFVVDDDNFTRMTQFRYCKCQINTWQNSETKEWMWWWEHFRGFEATIYSPLTGAKTQKFGTMDEDCIS